MARARSCLRWSERRRRSSATAYAASVTPSGNSTTALSRLAARAFAKVPRLWAVAYFFGAVPPAVPPVVELVAPAPVPVYVAPPVLMEVEVVAPAPVLVSPVFVVVLVLVVVEPPPLPERLPERLVVPDWMLMLGAEPSRTITSLQPLLQPWPPTILWG
jgi:hypothetical protein